MTALGIFFCVLAAATAFLRAEMLRHRLDPKKDHPMARPTYAGNYFMIVGLDLAGLGFVGMLISLHVRQIVPSPELLFLLATCSISSGITLVSMIGHNWREFLRCMAEDCAVEVERTLPEALEAGVKAFMAGDQVYEPEPPSPSKEAHHHVRRPH